jgi:hypothetical protein
MAEEHGGDVHAAYSEMGQTGAKKGESSHIPCGVLTWGQSSPGGNCKSAHCEPDEVCGHCFSELLLHKYGQPQYPLAPPPNSP